MDTERDYVDYSDMVVYNCQPMKRIRDVANDDNEGDDDTDNNSVVSSSKTIMSDFTSSDELDDVITDIPPQFRSSIWGANQQANLPSIWICDYKC